MAGLLANLPVSIMKGPRALALVGTCIKSMKLDAVWSFLNDCPWERKETIHIPTGPSQPSHFLLVSVLHHTEKCCCVVQKEIYLHLVLLTLVSQQRILNSSF